MTGEAAERPLRIITQEEKIMQKITIDMPNKVSSMRKKRLTT